MKLEEVKNKIAEYKGTTLTKTVPMILVGRLYSDYFILKGQEKTYIVKNNRVIKEFIPEAYEEVKNLLEVEVSLVIQNNCVSSVTQETYSELVDLFDKNRHLEAIEEEITFFNSIS